MKAIIKKDLGHAELVTNHPKPEVRADYLLIKTRAVALNPIDWMKVDFFPAPGTLIGSDYAGIIEAVGSGVSDRFRKGQRVCGYTIGGDHTKPENGAFAEYILAKAETQYHIPDHMGFEETATIGAAVMTANMGLYLELKLAEDVDGTPMSTAGGRCVLIYGGSTSWGAIAIQMAAQSGYEVVSTSSARDIEFVRSLGAKHVFDYKNPECGALIRKTTDDQLAHVLGTIATPSAAAIRADAISSNGGKYISLLPVELPRTDVQAAFMDPTTSMGEYFEYGSERMQVEVDAEAYEFAKARVEVVQKLLNEGLIKPHRVEIGSDGLKGVFDGLQCLRERQMSGQKLVYRIDETP